VDQIEAGGFDNFTLLSNGLLSFEGDLSLAMGQSLHLYAGAFGLADIAAEDTRIELAAPYVRLAGAGATESQYGYIRATVHGGLSSISSFAMAGTFDVRSGQLLEIRDGVAFGARSDGNANIDGLTEAVDLRGFDD